MSPFFGFMETTYSQMIISNLNIVNIFFINVESIPLFLKFPAPLPSPSYLLQCILGTPFSSPVAQDSGGGSGRLPWLILLRGKTARGVALKNNMEWILFYILLGHGLTRILSYKSSRAAHFFIHTTPMKQASYFIGQAPVKFAALVFLRKNLTGQAPVKFASLHIFDIFNGAGMAHSC